MRVPAAAFASALVAALPVPALASDAGMISAAGRASAVATAVGSANPGSPTSVQRAYDSARDMREVLRRAMPVSQSCAAHAAWAVRFADAATAVADGYDRLSPSRVRAARRGVARARAGMIATRSSCSPGTGSVRRRIPALRAPRPGAAFFGQVVVRRPVGADSAELLIGGRVLGSLVMRADGTARGRVVASPGRYDMEVRFRRAGAIVGRAISRRVWLLPPSAAGSVRPATASSALQQRLQAAAAHFDGMAAIWVHDLATGAAGSWNAGARFPAASTVKLGVMVAALARTGTAPERSSLAVDIASIGAWSSNLAPNRLMRAIGGPAAAQAALHRMGARSSTYPGDYIVATSAPPAQAIDQPLLATGRVTTAADMGRAITTVHRAALGVPAALRALRLSRAQARLLLGDLLASEPVADNRGIVLQALPSGVLVAQKNGWISSTRATVAIAYTSHGPVVLVVLANRVGLSRQQAAALGTEVVRAVVG